MYSSFQNTQANFVSNDSFIPVRSYLQSYFVICILKHRIANLKGPYGMLYFKQSTLIASEVDMK